MKQRVFRICDRLWKLGFVAISGKRQPLFVGRVNLPMSKMSNKLSSNNFIGRGDMSRVSHYISSNSSALVSANTTDFSFVSVSDQQMLLINTWEKYCKLKTCQHDLCYVRFRAYNIWISIGSLVLSGLAGIAMLGVTPTQQSGSCDSQNNKSVVYYILASFSIFGGILTAINKICKYAELQEQHDIYCDAYSVLYNDIIMNKTIFLTHESIFKSPIEFIKFINKRLDSLIDKEPSIPYAMKKACERADISHHHQRISNKENEINWERQIKKSNSIKRKKSAEKIDSHSQLENICENQTSNV